MIPPATSASCWVGTGKHVEVNGLGSLGSLLYYGQGLASVSSSSAVEPALINPQLPVAWPRGAAGSLAHVPHWPSYARIPPVARGEYLRWLASGRKDPAIEIGCVFLYFYGLERRVLADLRQQPEAARDLPAILTELARLLSAYGKSSSFFVSASALLDIVAMLSAKDRVYLTPPPAQGAHALLTLRHRLALGQAARDGVPLPPAWAYSWLINDDRFRLPPVAIDCPKQFQSLFLHGYTRAFGAGAIFPVAKAKLTTFYRPASSSFGPTPVPLPKGCILPVAVLDSTIERMNQIAHEVAASLQPYHHYNKRAHADKGPLLASLLLPPDLWPPEVRHALTSWLERLGATKSMQATQLREMREALPNGLTLGKEELRVLAAGFERLSVGIEPDIRRGEPIPDEAAQLVLFPLPPGEHGAGPLPTAAALALYLALTALAAGGGVAVEFRERVTAYFNSWLHLNAGEESRLQARLALWFSSAPSLSTLKRHCAHLTQDQKEAIATFLTTVVGSSGSGSPAGVKALTKAYRLLGSSEDKLYSRLHAAATDPVTVQPPALTASRFGVPANPNQKDGVVTLDVKRIAALTAESERISAILHDIFVEAAVTPLAPKTPKPTAVPPGVSVAGLDATHSALVRLLASRAVWTRAELERIAADQGFMLDGALERINDAFFATHDEPFLDGDDPVEVNKKIAKELPRA